jgi:hypothetical protein
MRKLKLQVEDLEVATFRTTEVPEERGTVVGHKTAPPSMNTCPGYNTCDAPTYHGEYTCAYTCNCTGAANCYSQITVCGGCEPAEA